MLWLAGVGFFRELEQQCMLKPLAIQTVNLKSGSLSDPLPGVVRVYIGRAFAGRAGSPLGNPEPLRRGASLEERDANVDRYRQWLRQQYRANGPVRAELERLLAIAESQPLELACYCAPLRCHGDEIKRALLGMAAQRSVQSIAS